MKGWTWTEFERTPPLPTYLLAMAVTSFRSPVSRLLKTCDRQLPMRFWAKPELVADGWLDKAVDMAPTMIHSLERDLGVPFPHAKLDFLELTERAHFAAMENWGFIIFKYVTKMAPNLLK